MGAWAAAVPLLAYWPQVSIVKSGSGVGGELVWILLNSIDVYMSGGPIQDERQKMPLAVIDRRGGRRICGFYSESGLAIVNNKLNHVVAT